jgi:hypothetical protein
VVNDVLVARAKADAVFFQPLVVEAADDGAQIVG